MKKVQYIKKTKVKEPDKKQNETILVSHNNMKDKDVYEWSAYGQAEFNLNPFKILLGLRHTENEFKKRHSKPMKHKNPSNHRMK